MRYFSVFSGVGGFELGLPESWECIGISEVDKNANKVLKYRFSKVRNYGDIEKIEYEKLPDFDVLVGGSPCQDISMAGKRAGINGKRSRLFFFFVAILKVKKPHYFIFENVKGLFSSNEGWDFAEVVNQFSKEGYSIWWQVLDSSQFGIPQHRERVFILGSLGEKGFREVFFEQDNSSKDTKLQRQSSNTIRKRYKGGQSVGSYVVEGKLDAQIKDARMKINVINPAQTQARKIYDTDGLAPSLGSIGHGGIAKKKIIIHSLFPRSGKPDEGGTGHLSKESDTSYAITTGKSGTQAVEYEGKIRYLTPLECERLMGWPDNWTRYGIDENGNRVELSDNARYNLIGNGVVPQIVKELVDKIMIEKVEE